MVFWTVHRIVYKENSYTDHIVGYCNYTDHIVGYCNEGRVSSKIVKFDKKDRIATTKSGRRYVLNPNNVGTNSDTQYVFSIWKNINKVSDTTDVTEEYLPKKKQLKPTKSKPQENIDD